MAKKKSDETKRQRLAFEFFGDHFREDKTFTLADLAAKTGWTPKTASTYLSKHFEPFTKPVPPILKAQQQKHQAYRVTDVLLMIGKWSKFRRHVSQKRKLTYEYDLTIYSTVLIFEFFLPLTNETVLRNELDALFFKNTIHKKLLTNGLVELKAQIEPKPQESDKDYLDRVVAWFGQQIRGYSISHVSGRFRGEDVVLSIQDAAALQERAGRYLIDETTAITRFIFPCKDVLSSPVCRRRDRSRWRS
jgi:hypothetical protein